MEEDTKKVKAVRHKSLKKLNEDGKKVKRKKPKKN